MDEIDVYVATDFVGCARTRRSTSGGAALLGTHVIKHWSTTQSTVSLSSVETELTSFCRGASHAMGLQNILRDLGWAASLRVHSYSSAAVGVCKRRVLGKVRHFAVSDMRVRDRIAANAFKLDILRCADGPACILTKAVGEPSLEKHMARLRLEAEEGRAASAAQIGAQVACVHHCTAHVLKPVASRNCVDDAYLCKGDEPSNLTTRTTFQCSSCSTASSLMAARSN